LTAAAVCSSFAAQHPAGNDINHPIIRLPHAAAAGLLLRARQTGDIDRLTAAAAGRPAARRSAANASSVTLSGVVGS